MGRRDAIKVLKKSLAQDEEAIARFIRGAKNASRVRHPNVCSIYDCAETDEGLVFVAMEFIDGESLHELLAREKALPLTQAAQIVKQTADALQAAHEAGIVHRDLKPANIMLTRGRGGAQVREGGRLRHRKGIVGGRVVGPDSGGVRHRHARVHEPGAAHCGQPGRPQRRLFPRDGPVPDVDGPSPVRLEHVPGGDGPAPDHGSSNPGHGRSGPGTFRRRSSAFWIGPWPGRRRRDSPTPTPSPTPS